MMEKLYENPEDIASVCHEANRAFCLTIGDNSQLPWDECADWQRQSSIDGVEFFIENPDSTPEDMHQAWMKEKKGWKYGTVKDSDKKTHPSFLPYDQLSTEEKLKDSLFQNICRTLLKLT